MENLNKNLKVTHSDTSLVSYCGFYCGSCSKYIKQECIGCRGDNSKCSIGYKTCKVKPCCTRNNFSTCAECTISGSVKDCKDFNPLMIRFGQFITQTSRRKGIEMIKQKGLNYFVDFMKDRNWVTMKNKPK